MYTFRYRLDLAWEMAKRRDLEPYFDRNPTVDPDVDIKVWQPTIFGRRIGESDIIADLVHVGGCGQHRHSMMELATRGPRFEWEQVMVPPAIHEMSNLVEISSGQLMGLAQTILGCIANAYVRLPMLEDIL